MKPRTKLILNCAAPVLAVSVSMPSAMANLLVDPGYEANPLNTAANVLNNFPTYQGDWGQEAATITGVDGGITPVQGVKMLRMVDDGQTATQCFQSTDVTSYAALIDSGGATVNMSALFDASPNLPSAVGAVYVSFFTANNYATLTTTVGNTLNLDNVPSTWEPISLNAAIPAGTRWLVSQVVYNDASLYSNGAMSPGYVDAADLTVAAVPEPTSLSMLAAGLFFLARRRRRQA